MTGQAPSVEEIEALARAALAALPDSFRTQLSDVILRIEEFADDATLAGLGLDDPFDLTGLYEGRPLTERSSTDWGALPDTITLYRRPILEEWIETEVALDTLVNHVVVHEVGHHFGLSDDDMHRIEDEA